MEIEGSFGTSVYTYQTAGVTRLEDNNLHSHHSHNLKFVICDSRLKFPPYNVEFKITLNDRNVTWQGIIHCSSNSSAFTFILTRLNIISIYNKPTGMQHLLLQCRKHNTRTRLKKDGHWSQYPISNVNAITCRPPILVQISILPLQSPEPWFLSNTVLQSCHHYGILHEVSQTERQIQMKYYVLWSSSFQSYSSTHVVTKEGINTKSHTNLFLLLFLHSLHFDRHHVFVGDEIAARWPWQSRQHEQVEVVEIVISLNNSFKV